MASKILRPSSILAVGFLLLALCGTSMRVDGNPLPDEGDIKQNIKDTYNDVSSKAEDFFQRFKNTFTGKADSNNPGLTTWEIIAIAAAAIFVFMFGFCCIGYCLCECVKELVCCICCCGCCRD